MYLDREENGLQPICIAFNHSVTFLSDSANYKKRMKSLIPFPLNYALISNWRLYFRERKQETFVETGGVVHVIRIAVCIDGVQNQEIQIDGLKSQLSDKQIN